MNRFILDTCALIWFAEGEGMADAAVEAIHHAFANHTPVAISPISAWEIGLLAARGRLRLAVHPGAWFRMASTAPGVRLAELNPDILVASSYLPGDPPRDPADRMLVATARELGLTLVTRDRTILRYADNGHVAALPC